MIPSVIKDLWVPNTTQLDQSKITMLFGVQAASIIMQVPINATQGNDILRWKPTPSGICTTKSAYKQLRLEHLNRAPPIHNPNQVIQILRQVWSDKLIQPRVKTFAWHLLRLAVWHSVLPPELIEYYPM